MLKSIQRDDHPPHDLRRLDGWVEPEELRLPIIGVTVFLLFVLSVIGYLGYQIWHLLTYWAPGWPF